jgi:hypothetical protein
MAFTHVLTNVVLCHDLIELSGDDKHWLVTIGFDIESQLEIKSSSRISDPLANILDTAPRKIYRRFYKRVGVDTETGEPKAMRIVTV